MYQHNLKVKFKHFSSYHTKLTQLFKSLTNNSGNCILYLKYEYVEHLGMGRNGYWKNEYWEKRVFIENNFLLRMREAIQNF